MKQVRWIKNTQNNEWFDFLRLNLESPYFNGKVGIYAIWYATPSSAKVIKVGSGNIAERLKDHRANQEITKYSSLGSLKVSWVVADSNPLSPDEIQGAEIYLANKYRPLVGDRFPNVQEIPISPIKK
ncbi:MAG: hypothetical protein Q7T51_02455 [Candidatus Moranbacteria bacterium]|nr:hypothetical protein [Candidatus Moranbacteria bacterium]